jgi:hypothetical protein
MIAKTSRKTVLWAQKKVALVAVMHKFLHYIFAVLRDEKTFALRSPEDHPTWRKDKNSHLSIVE